MEAQPDEGARARIREDRRALTQPDDSIAPRPPDGRLSGIEAVRGIAAVMVVLYHVARHLDQNHSLPGLRGALQFGHSGVDLFFVLSGFIILHVHQGDIGRPDRLGRYLARRVSRVLPTYWVALAIVVSISLAAGHGLPERGRLLESAVLLPSREEPLLGVAWTLQYEMVFYVVFGVLICSRRLGAALLVGWLGWILLGWAAALPPVFGLPPMLWGVYDLEFFLGMTAAWWLGRGAVPGSRGIALLGAAGFVLAAAGENAGLFDGYAGMARLFYGLPSALLILGLAGWERRTRLPVPGWLRVVGGASYSIYLFQFIVIGIVWKLWVTSGLDGALPGWTGFPVLAGAAIIGGLAASRLVERPILRLIRAPDRNQARPKPPNRA